MEIKLKADVAFLMTILILSFTVLPVFEEPLRWLFFMFIVVVLRFWAKAN